MNQRLNATTPTALLASTVANIANQVGGYKDGFAADRAYQLLHNLFNADQDTDDFVQAFNELRSIWDRAEGASTIIDSLGPMALEVQIDLADNVVYLNGKDTRQDLVDTIDRRSALLERAAKALEEGQEVIANLSAERDKFRDMVMAAACGGSREDELHPDNHPDAAYASGPDPLGDGMPTVEDVEAMVREQFGIPGDVSLTVFRVDDFTVEPNFVEGLKKAAGTS